MTHEWECRIKNVVERKKKMNPPFKTLAHTMHACLNNNTIQTLGCVMPYAESTECCHFFVVINTRIPYMHNGRSKEKKIAVQSSPKILKNSLTFGSHILHNWKLCVSFWLCGCLFPSHHFTLTTEKINRSFPNNMNQIKRFMWSIWWLSVHFMDF